MVLVDTSVWIDHLANVLKSQTLWLSRYAEEQRIGLTDLLLSELLQGVRDDFIFAQVKRDMLRFEVLTTRRLDTARAAAQNYRTLRAHGITIRKTIDCLITTFCITHNHTLLHRDRDFDPFERHLGLDVLHPHQACPAVPS